MTGIAEKTAAYLAQQWGTEVHATAETKIFGGASRETFRVSLTVDGEPRDVIVRRDPPTSLIDTERALEFNAYQGVYGTGIPVPEPLALENDPSWLGAPFSVMAAIDDAVTDVSGLTQDERGRIGSQKWQILGQLAAMDPVKLGFDEFLPVPAPEDCARRELDYWAGVIRDDEMHPQPVAAAAVRWLEANLPAPAQKVAIVHGDYRTGNFLYDTDNGIRAILDWEMCHLGDPLEDLAWSMDPLWCWNDPGLPGRLLPAAEVIAIWESASGLTVNPDDLHWWRVRVALKAVAIWISSSEDFASAPGKDTILAMAGWVMTQRQNQILLDYLSPLSDHELTRVRA